VARFKKSCKNTFRCHITQTRAFYISMLNASLLFLLCRGWNFIEKERNALTMKVTAIKDGSGAAHKINHTMVECLKRKFRSRSFNKYQSVNFPLVSIVLLSCNPAAVQK
jgi:hypothetical protein